MHWVLYMLCSLVCCDCRIHVDSSARSCARPIVLCVPSRVGTSPNRLGTHSHPLPLQWKNHWHKIHLQSPGMWNPLIARQSRPLFCADKQELRQTFKIMATGPSYWIGLPHQTVWGLVGTSYWDDPLNVGGSSTVNKYLGRLSLIRWHNLLPS